MTLLDETRGLIASGVAELTRVATTPPAPWLYGRDLVCVTDLTPTLEETDPTTTQSLAQDIYHRITTERGSLVDDPDFGEDVRGYLSSATTPRELFAIGGRLEAEILKDDRVRSVTVDVQGNTSELNITISVTPDDPTLEPFRMILAVTSAEALLQEIS
jgi:hypothetical protein